MLPPIKELDKATVMVEGMNPIIEPTIKEIVDALEIDKMKVVSSP